MNTINLENQNRIDDLRIEKAISGLTEQQLGELRDLFMKQSGDGDRDANEIEARNPLDDVNDFERCIAVIDVWMAGSSDVTLSSDQRHRLMDEFVVGSPDRNLSRKYQSKPKRFRAPASWLLASALVAAAVCLVLASTVWVNQPNPGKQDLLVSAAELRKHMLENPPGDLVHWVWSSPENSDADNPFLGDVIWSDLMQQGFALMNVTSPIADPALYQLQLFQQLENELANGVLCCEFRFDGYSEPFVVIIRPEKEVIKAERFTIARSAEEPAMAAGPNDHEQIMLVAESGSTDALAETGEGGNVPEKGAVISSEQTTTF